MAGDVCHYNLTAGISNTQLGKIIAQVPITEISICTNGQSRPLTEADISAFPEPPQG